MNIFEETEQRRGEFRQAKSLLWTTVGAEASESLTFNITILTHFPAAFVDVRLRKLAEEKDELLAQIRKLKNQLEEERQKHSKTDSLYTDGERMENGTDLHFIEMQSKLLLCLLAN